MQEIRFQSPFGEWRIVRTAPPPDLADWVSEFWETRGVVGYGHEKLLPSGTAEFMVNLGPPQMVLRNPTDPAPTLYGHAWLSGIQDRPLLTAPAHGSELFTTHFVSASLKPEGVCALFGMDAIHTSNRVIDADALIGRGVRALRDRLGETSTTRQRFSALVGFLRSAHARQSRPAPFAAIWAIGHTLNRNGNVRVDRLCNELGVSRKHLNTLYKRAVGISPKTFARLTRFRAVVERLENPADSWADIAIDRGYFDQAHLIRDFNRFAGESPASFLDSRAPDRESVNYAEREPGGYSR